MDKSAPEPDDDKRLAAALLMFTPERWGQVERFQHLHGKTYTFADRDRRALAGVDAHFKKALIFRDIADELRPSLEIDCAELNGQGFTPARHSRKLGAIVEAVVIELYGSIDCTVQILRAIYKPHTSGFRDSVRSFFLRHEAITGLPRALSDAVAEASWFPDLVYLRDDLTHSNTGSCDLEEESRRISYSHFGMKRNGAPFRIDDIYQWLDTHIDLVNAFLGAVFHHLGTTVGAEPIEQMCGMTKGRMLMRLIYPAEPLSFDNGLCRSHHWFELPENPICPFVEHCGAYRRAKAMETTSP